MILNIGQVQIIGKIVNIMIIYDDEREIIHEIITDEYTYEKLDNDHVLHDIMYQVLWNGIP
jgi:hypothetical protein